MYKLPLKGTRILDLGSAWAVPIATKPLALLGAEVIHIESCQRPDISRFGTHVDNETTGSFWETGGRHHSINLSKLGITLDLTKEAGVQIFRELVKVSDVVAENFSPRVMKNLGLDYHSLRELKPDIIMLSSSAFGHTGPWANYVGWGMSLEPISGISHLTGYTDRPPNKSTIPYTDVPAALHATFAILAALYHRRKTGQGQFIDLSQYEVAVQQSGEALMDYVLNHRIEGRMGNRHSSMAPHGVYRCQGNDKWVAISVSSDAEWQALCEAMGNPPWTEEERFWDALSRWRNQDELDGLIEKWTMTKDHREAMHTLQKAGVPAGAVFTSKELLLDPHLKERGFFHLITHPQLPGMERVGMRPIPGLPWKMSGTIELDLHPAATLGQHNEYVLIELLGFSKERIADLTEKGVIGTAPLAEEAPPGSMPTVPLSLMKELGYIEEYDDDFMDILGLKERGDDE